MAAPLTLGFDLGGTQLRAALVQGGQVLQRAALPTDVTGGPEAVLRQFQALADQVSAGADVQAVGLASPGPLDTIAGVVDDIPTLPGWNSFPILARMSDLFRLPAVVENDAIAAAYGEWRYGAGKGVSNMIYATISTGIGGGAVVDGQLLHGSRGMATHFGHLRMDPAGPVCGCGGSGCFEALASGTALGARAAALAQSQPASWLGLRAAQDRITARHVAEGARLGDSACLALLEQEAVHLGRGFTSLAHLFSPERCVMGGGVSAAFDLLQATIHATIRREALPPFQATPVVAAALGDNAGLVGVAALALGRLDAAAGRGKGD